MHSEVLNVRFRPAQLVIMTKSGYLHIVGNKLPVCGSLGFNKTCYALLASDIYVCLEGVCLQLVVPTQGVFFLIMVYSNNHVKNIVINKITKQSVVAKPQLVCWISQLIKAAQNFLLRWVF